MVPTQQYPQPAGADQRTAGPDPAAGIKPRRTRQGRCGAHQICYQPKHLACTVQGQLEQIIEPHRRFSYDGVNMINSKKTIPLDRPFGQSKTSTNPRLEDLERKISRNFFEAAEALREIRDDKLYLAYAETFKEYCEKRLDRSIRAVYEQLKMLEIHEEIQGIESAHGAQTHSIGEGLTTKRDKKYVKDLRKLARTPVVAKSPEKPKEITIEMPTPEDKQRAKRWNQAMAKLNAAKDRDEEGFLEALEAMLENWGV
jgi:hypothetical protein